MEQQRLGRMEIKRDERAGLERIVSCRSVSRFWRARGRCANCRALVESTQGIVNIKETHRQRKGAAPRQSDADGPTRRYAKRAAPGEGTVRSKPAFLFDLDGTLVDSVYQHVLAWREALEEAGIELAVWRIHRRIGMSGGLFMNALLREIGRQVTAEEAARLQQMHRQAYLRQVRQVRPLPGARELLAYLSQVGVPWAIATSGRLETARPALDTLGLGPEAPVITRDQVQRAKPDPDLFLTAAAHLRMEIRASIMVGDSV